MANNGYHGPRPCDWRFPSQSSRFQVRSGRGKEYNFRGLDVGPGSSERPSLARNRSRDVCPSRSKEKCASKRVRAAAEILSLTVKPDTRGESRVTCSPTSQTSSIACEASRRSLFTARSARKDSSAPLSKCLTSRGIGSRARMLTLTVRPRGPSKLRSLSR